MSTYSFLQRSWVIHAGNSTTDACLHASPSLNNNGSSIPTPVLVNADQSYRLMHFNVLADELTSDADFLGTSKEDLAWDNRKLRLLEIIKEVNPDILSLVECDHYEDFWVPELIKLGFEWSQKVTKSTMSPKKTHGVVIFIKATIFRVSNIILIRDPVAAICLILEDKMSNRFGLITTHLKAKKNSEMRSIQMKKIIDEYRFMCSQANEKYGSKATLKCRSQSDLHFWEIPLIFTGDFNTGLHEECIEYVQKELHLKPGFILDWTTWKERVKSSWQDGGVVKRAIDHMLVGNKIQVMSHLGLPKDKDVEEAGLLPGTKYPSDHLAIAMDFVI